MSSISWLLDQSTDQFAPRHAERCAWQTVHEEPDNLILQVDGKVVPDGNNLEIILRDDMSLRE
jgi:hypothetical protein